MGDAGDRLRRWLDTAAAEAGFASLELEEFRVPWPAMPRLVSPHVAGTATAPSASGTA